jgi:hypothetical protein
MDRQIERGAGDQFLVVHIAAIAAKVAVRATGPHAGGGATTMTPKNGLSGSSRPHGQPSDHARTVKGNMNDTGICEIVGQCASERPNEVVAQS